MAGNTVYTIPYYIGLYLIYIQTMKTFKIHLQVVYFYIGSKQNNELVSIVISFSVPEKI